MKNIFFFGGSFDPPHIGHQNIVDLCLPLCDYFIIIPAQQSPHKLSRPTASGIQRLQMLKLIFSYTDKILIDPVELYSKNPKFTFHTILYLQEKYKGAELTLVLGADQWSNFENWYRWKDICEKINLYCFNRNGKITETVNSGYDNIKFNTEFDINISSTEIREIFKYDFKQARRYLQLNVYEYIISEGIYL